MTALVVTALTVLVVAGGLLLALTHHHRQENPMPEHPITPGGLPRRFDLVRHEDVSGVSGTGLVAEGVAFSDGTAVIHWVAGEHRSTVVWPSVESVEAIHGHGGATEIRWIDIAGQGA